ncbi:MAG: diacylglycerol kinase family protein [Gemmatimonadaceae bacterium]
MTERIPVFINPSAGNADDVTAALERDGSFDIREVEPDALQEAVRAAVRDGAARVAVAGGDGTVASAATALSELRAELAILPAGTLNHFAKDSGIPEKPEEAVALARGGGTRRADTAYVNNRLFLNTSSVGLYVAFVRSRERLERYLGYRLASFVAAIRVFLGAHHVVVTLEIEGKKSTYRTPLVFVGVGERELKLPTLGGRVDGGQSSLHVIVVRGRTRAGLAALAFAAAARGVKHLARTPHLDSFLVDTCSIDLRGPSGNVAVDGETVRMKTPLDYRISREELTIVAPG